MLGFTRLCFRMCPGCHSSSDLLLLAEKLTVGGCPGHGVNTFALNYVEFNSLQVSHVDGSMSRPFLNLTPENTMNGSG